MLLSLFCHEKKRLNWNRKGKTLSGLVSYSCDMKNTIKWVSMQLIVLQRQWKAVSTCRTAFHIAIYSNLIIKTSIRSRRVSNNAHINFVSDIIHHKYSSFLKITFRSQYFSSFNHFQIFIIKKTSPISRRELLNESVLNKWNLNISFRDHLKTELVMNVTLFNSHCLWTIHSSNYMAGGLVPG